MTMFKRFVSVLVLLALAACGGGGGSAGKTPFGDGSGSGGSGSGGTTTGAPSLGIVLSNTTVSSAAPVTVTATVANATGAPVPNVVVKFSTLGNLGTFSATSALTNASGAATVTLSPVQATSTGADTVVATSTVGTTAVTGQAGFSLVATTAAITSFTSASGMSASSPLSAYGQTVLTVNLSGVSSVSPATLTVNSACGNKVTLSPSTTIATSGSVAINYKDTGGCGSTLAVDTLTATISGANSSSNLQLYLSAPAANNVVFVSATPPTIFLQGTGLTTSSQVVFQVNDLANNPLPGQVVNLALNTFVGGLTINGAQSTVSQTTDSNGQVAVLVNAGTVPTPARVTATLASNPNVSTVSSNLSIAVGLPSETHFSLAEQTINIEGYDHYGTANTYTVIASDRMGNPVPNGTAINFVSEGGQVQAQAFTATIPNASAPCPVATGASSATGTGLSCAVAQFQSAAPVPRDGRVTVMAYALGEKSFIDANGNNVYDAGESFQDLGNPYLDTLFNGQFGASVNNQYFTQTPSGSSVCNPLALAPSLQLDVSISSQPNTCTGSWGKAYVRRSIETIFSTSTANPMWIALPGTPAYFANASECNPVSLIVPNTGSTFPAYNADGSANRANYLPFGATAMYNVPATGTLYFYSSDNNPIAFNPLPARTTITAAATNGLAATPSGGTPVANTAEPPGASVNYTFTAPTTSGTVTVTFTTPGGTGTSISQFISTGAPPAGKACP